jgi:iron complex outermembrane receptor protein
MNYKNIMLGSGKMGINYSANFTLQNELDGEVRNLPSVVALPGNQSVFGETQQALLLTSRPKTKHILGIDYSVSKWGFSLNNTLFGKAEFMNADVYTDPDPLSATFGKKGLTVEFQPKLVTDLGVNYKATEKFTVSLNANNLFNVLPEWKLVANNAYGESVLNNPSELANQINDLTFNGRYSQMTYDGSHFSQLGTIWNLSLSYKF